MRNLEIRWGLAVSIFLIASCAVVSGAELEAFRHLLTLPLDYDPTANIPPYGIGSPLDVTFSPDGKILAAAFNEKGVLLFDLPSGQLATTVKQPNERALCVTFSPDGKFLAHSGSGAWLWNVATGQPKSCGEHPLWIDTVAFSPDGTLLGVGTSRDPFHVWDLASGKSTTEFDLYAGTDPKIDKGLYKPNVAAIAFSPDGKTLAAQIHFYEDELPIFDQIQIWDLGSRKLRAAFRGTGGLFTPDGETLIYEFGGKIKLRSVKNIEDMESIETETRIASGGYAAMALSRDGMLLATSGEDHAIQLWNLPARKLIASLNGHTRRISSVAISNDATRVASSSDDGSIRLWEMGSR